MIKGSALVTEAIRIAVHHKLTEHDRRRPAKAKRSESMLMPKLGIGLGAFSSCNKEKISALEDWTGLYLYLSKILSVVP